MVVPYDERLGVHPQSEGFTDHARWDFEGTGPDQYPLLLHFPYFDLYRKQVVKQADLVLALHLRGDAFTAEEKERNFAYYEALTVRDSSLSACTQAVVAAEIGHLELAYDYLGEAALVDLADLDAQHRRRPAHGVAGRRVDRRWSRASAACGRADGRLLVRARGCRAPSAAWSSGSATGAAASRSRPITSRRPTTSATATRSPSSTIPTPSSWVDKPERRSIPSPPPVAAPGAAGRGERPCPGSASSGTPRAAIGAIGATATYGTRASAGPRSPAARRQAVRRGHRVR